MGGMKKTHSNSVVALLLKLAEITSFFNIIHTCIRPWWLLFCILARQPTPKNRYIFAVACVLPANARGKVQVRGNAGTAVDTVEGTETFSKLAVLIKQAKHCKVMRGTINLKVNAVDKCIRLLHQIIFCLTRNKN